MTDAIASPAGGVVDERAFRRVMAWSFGVHVAAIVLLFVLPREWIMGRQEEVRYMSVSLGGSIGPQTTGMTPIGGRTVEQVVPPTRRPDPIPVTPPKAVPTTGNQVVKLPEPKPVQTPPTTTAARAPTPATGRQVQQGNTRVETGASGEGRGLSQGGGGGATAEVAADFCCPDYVQLMKVLIDREWTKTLPGRGTTILRFAIQRDGRITDVSVEKQSGDINLDIEARRALSEVKMPPLPAEYTESALQVRLRFPYGGG